MVRPSAGLRPPEDANQARRDAPRVTDERRAEAVRQQLAEMGFAGADADDGLLRACAYDVARVIDRLVEGGAGAAGDAAGEHAVLHDGVMSSSFGARGLGRCE